MKVDMKSREAVSKGAGRYVVGHVERFDQKNEMFKRPIWDPSMMELGRKFHIEEVMPKDKPGYMLKDQAFRNAAWWLEFGFAMGVAGGRVGLFAWESKLLGETRPPKGLKMEVDDPARVTREIKRVAKFYGASLVGVCELDRRWIYSHTYYTFPHPKRHEPIEEIEIPEEYKYAVVTAVEMDYEGIKTSPALPAAGAVGLGYSHEAFVAGLVAQYIRGLGYKAIPSGNDTACSIPIAIDAGLGELSRSGLLITPEFGPRVRISKVFTDLPLVPDQPIEFGVWDFCNKCQKCAEHCPSQAIMYGEPTTQINNMSNREGLFRWPINAEKCFSYWAANGASCANCIRVCPFNKSSGWLHSLIRWGVKNTRWMDSTFVRLDNFFGYGKQASAERFWEQ